MLELTLVIWLAKGGIVERPVDRRQCGEAMSLFQSAIATGRPILHIDDAGARQVVLDVRCKPRGQAATS